MDELVSLVTSIIMALVALVAAGYGLSLLIHKRTMDAVQSTAAATLTATQALIAQMTYYGASERAEIIRTVAQVIGVDQLRDTALQFQSNRVYTIEQYPPKQ